MSKRRSEERRIYEENYLLLCMKIYGHSVKFQRTTKSHKGNARMKLISIDGEDFMNEVEERRRDPSLEQRAIDKSKESLIVNRMIEILKMYNNDVVKKGTRTTKITIRRERIKLLNGHPANEIYALGKRATAELLKCKSLIMNPKKRKEDSLTDITDVEFSPILLDYVSTIINKPPDCQQPPEDTLTPTGPSNWLGVSFMSGADSCVEGYYEDTNDITTNSHRDINDLPGELCRC